jgi:hypothetical protein
VKRDRVTIAHTTLREHAAGADVEHARHDMAVTATCCCGACTDHDGEMRQQRGVER